jgi:hypothetical protein
MGVSIVTQNVRGVFTRLLDTIKRVGMLVWLMLFIRKSRVSLRFSR